MVAVGFNPRGGGKIARRRGATLEGLIARPRADSGVAPRRGSVFPSVRGLKPAEAHGYPHNLALRGRTGSALAPKK